ncbi:MAG: mucoidy inhibitor MuiA family protein [Alsobacter sp.]
MSELGRGLGLTVRAAAMAGASLGTMAVAMAADIEAPSRIASVVVYPDGASVTRTVKLDLPAGSNALVVRGVGPSVDPGSIRVEGAADGDLTIGAVDVRATPGDPNAAANPELQRQLTALRDQRSDMQARLAALEAKKATIESYGKASPEKLGTGSAPLPVEQWAAAWNAVADGLAQAGLAIAAQQREITDLDRTIAALEATQSRGPRPGLPLRDIVVAVDAAAATRGELRVTYRVGGASWTPVYDARLDTGAKDVKPSLSVVRRARISQRTGEDWTDVALAVSTVRTNRGTAAPDAQPVLVSLYEAPVAAAAAENSAGRALSLPAPAAPAMMQDELKDAAKPVRKAAEQVAQLEAGGYQASFKVPGTVSVPQDGTAKSVALSSRTWEPVLAVKAVPAQDETAYLAAAFVNDEDAPLLPGEVSLTRDGTYVGRGRLRLVAPGDRVELGFGADDKVKVSRVPVRKKETEPGWVGNTRTDQREFKTTIRNLHATPLRITVLDQLPVSEHGLVTVEQLPATTAPTEKTVDDKRGVMGWTWDYLPGEQKEIRLAYKLKWPADRELVFRPQGPGVPRPVPMD